MKRKPKNAFRDIVSELLPVGSRSRAAIPRETLIFGLITAALVVTLFILMGLEEWVLFVNLIGLYLGTIALVLLYRFAGATTPRAVTFGVGLATALLLLFAVPLYGFLFRTAPGTDPFQLTAESGLLEMLWTHFVGAGLMEELLKATPLLILLAVALHRPDVKGLRGPIDGIILGAVAGLVFTWFETGLQYVQVAESPADSGAVGAAPQEVNAAAASMLYFPRLIAALSGHMAYAGYFGYFIGLARLRPENGLMLLLTGWVTAALLHAFWNSLGLFFGFFVGLASFLFLISAILKAKEIEARELASPAAPAPAAASPVVSPMVPAKASPKVGPDSPRARPAPAVPAPASPGAFPAAAAAPLKIPLLQIGNLVIELRPETQINSDQYPGLATEGGAAFRAEVARHPKDPGLIGLRNVGDTDWTVGPRGKPEVTLAPGQTLRIVRGTTIRSGAVVAQIV